MLGKLFEALGELTKWALVFFIYYVISWCIAAAVTIWVGFKLYEFGKMGLDLLF